MSNAVQRQGSSCFERIDNPRAGIVCSSSWWKIRHYVLIFFSVLRELFAFPYVLSVQEVRKAHNIQGSVDCWLDRRYLSLPSTNIFYTCGQTACLRRWCGALPWSRGVNVPPLIIHSEDLYTYLMALHYSEVHLYFVSEWGLIIITPLFHPHPNNRKVLSNHVIDILGMRCSIHIFGAVSQ